MSVMHISYKHMQQTLDIDGHRSGEKSLDNLGLDEKTTTKLPRYDRYYPEVISGSHTQTWWLTISDDVANFLLGSVWKTFIEKQHGKIQSTTECNPFESKSPESHHLY